MNNEKPLEKLEVVNGGFTSIFQTIACIGDSLSSGEFETQGDDCIHHGYHDMFEYSWGQFMARDAGIKVYNFSRGGMTAKEYVKSFGESIDAYNKDKKCKAYIIALGVNDLLNSSDKTPGPIDDYEKKKESFSRYYQEIIVKYKEIEPNAKFFLMTMVNDGKPDNTEGDKQKVLAHRDFLYGLSLKYSNTYVLDIYKYGPKYDDEFISKYYMLGHLNPMGYRLTANMVESYIDYIVRNDMEAFKQVGLIGTPFYDKRIEK